MFELPEAKRVRRAELQSSSSRSASPDPKDGSENNSAARAALASLFSSRFGDLDTERKQTRPKPTAKSGGTAKSKSRSSASSSSDADDATTKREEEQPPSYSFRLFATPSNAPGTTGAESSTTGGKLGSQNAGSVNETSADLEAGQQLTHQIVLEPLDADDTGLRSRDIGRIVNQRPRSYYLAKPWSASHQQAASQSVIITAEQLAQEASRRWPGCTVPWRVKTVRVGRKGLAKLAAWSSSPPSQTALQSAETSKERNAVEARLVNADGTLARDGRAGRRAKPGKKTRLQLRKKIQAEIDKKQQAKLLEEQRAADKTRKNREKKVRRKLKMKEKEEKGTQVTVKDGVDGETAAN